MNIVSYATHHVIFEVKDENNVPKWVAVGVYGWPERAEKHNTWALVKRLKQSFTVHTIFFWDFDEILSACEKAGEATRSESQMDAFRETMKLCSLVDLGDEGGGFT